MSIRTRFSALMVATFRHRVSTKLSCATIICKLSVYFLTAAATQPVHCRHRSTADLYHSANSFCFKADCDFANKASKARAPLPVKDRLLKKIFRSFQCSRQRRRTRVCAVVVPSAQHQLDATREPSEQEDVRLRLLCRLRWRSE